MYNFDPNDVPPINTLQIAGTPLSAALTKCPNGIDPFYNKLNERQDMLEELEDVEATVTAITTSEVTFLGPEIDVDISESGTPQMYNNIAFGSPSMLDNENQQGKIEIFIFRSIIIIVLLFIHYKL